LDGFILCFLRGEKQHPILDAGNKRRGEPRLLVGLLGEISSAPPGGSRWLAYSASSALPGSSRWLAYSAPSAAGLSPHSIFQNQAPENGGKRASPIFRRLVLTSAAQLNASACFQ